MADNNNNNDRNSNRSYASSSLSSSQRAQASLTPLQVQRDPEEKTEKSSDQPARGRVAGTSGGNPGSELGKTPGGSSGKTPPSAFASDRSTTTTSSTSSSLQSSSGAPGFMKNTLDAVLRSPTVMMGAMKMKMNSRMGGNVVRTRTSVDPYRRAADQAVYRTSTLVHEAEGAGEMAGKDEGVRTIRYGRWEAEGVEAGEAGEARRGRWGKKKGEGGLNAELMKVCVGWGG